MKLTFKNVLLLALMLISAGLGAALRPNISMADERPPIDLAAMVPTAFDDWCEETNMFAQVINPQQKSVIDKIYSQTLSRTYVNKQGYRIMLSIAYGKSQSDALQLHKPEICYPAQGFQLLNKQSNKLDILGQPIATTQISTSLGQRFEPVTYWTVVGDHVVTTNISKKLAEIRYALTDRVPDGMLVRLSSIDTDTTNAFAFQRSFANSLAQAIPAEHRKRFVGDIAVN